MTGRVGSGASAIALSAAYDTRPVALRLVLRHAGREAVDVALVANAHGARAATAPGRSRNTTIAPRNDNSGAVPRAMA